MGDALADRVRRCVAAGVDWVQVRERELDGGPLLAHVDEILDAARRGASERGGTVRLLVNRRVDVAMAAEADGVHLGFDAVPPATARRLLGASAWIGVSTHAPGEVAPLRAAGASYAHLAPIFAPLSKRSEREPLGPAALAETARAGIPVLAQGGVSEANAGACIAAGAAGVAVTGALLLADDPARATRELRNLLDDV